jgi:hypothetical protein
VEAPVVALLLRVRDIGINLWSTEYLAALDYRESIVFPQYSGIV